MNVTAALLNIVEEAHSLTRILAAAMRVIAEQLEAGACSAFLLDEGGRLVRSAVYPLDREQAGDLADAEHLAAHVVAGQQGASGQAGTLALLGSPMLFRDNPVGVVVLERATGPAFSTDEAATLATICAQLVGIVENARIVDALDRGEPPEMRSPPAPAVAGPASGELILRGVAASPGIAIGTAVFRGAHHRDRSPIQGPPGDPSVERARVRTAIEKTRNDLLRIQAAAAREIDEEHALIFASHLLLLNDPMLLDRIDRKVGRGARAAEAIDVVLEDVEARLRLVPDLYIQEKTDDVDDLRSRLLEHVDDGVGRARFGRRIVLTRRIAPSLVIELKTEGAQALVTEVGSATSHGVLLARAMDIPTVTGLAEVQRAVQPGDAVIVDGTTGVVVVRPEAATLERYEREHRRAEHARTDHARLRDVHACTADGVRVSLEANVGVASDLAVARDNGAEGVGLYRTELPFIVRDAFPTRGEQVTIYRKAYDLFPVGRILFRLLDLGGDKFVTGGSIAAARSAFHGYRSIRVLFDHPHVLRDQVQALALAAADRPLRILIPMVSSLEELRRTKDMIAEALAALDEPRAQRAPEIGAMIEVPAAVEMAGDIAREVDFLSIGTNDLMQYALVVDREDARMASLSDPYHPAILRMIARVTADARVAGKLVGVCGEIATRPPVALALMALGVASLSVAPTAIPALKQALAETRLVPVQRAMTTILALSDAAAVAAALHEACAGMSPQTTGGNDDDT